MATIFYRCTFTAIQEIVIGCTQVFRRLLKCKKEWTILQMICFTIDPYDVIIRNWHKVLGQESTLVTSLLINSIVDSLYFNTSNVYKQWRNILFKL